MSDKHTRSILKKHRTPHNRTIRFKPDNELELVRQISNKEGDDNENWRRKASQTEKEQKQARKEAYAEKILREKEVGQILSDMKDARKDELDVIKGMNITQNQKSVIKQLFKPRTKEQEQEIAATMISVSRSKMIPLETVIASLETAHESPRRSTLSRMFKSVSRLFSCGTRRQGGKKRRQRKTKKIV
jgi:hypothetical protein